MSVSRWHNISLAMCKCFLTLVLQFLNSVLSTIGGNGSPAPSIQPQRPPNATSAQSSDRNQPSALPVVNGKAVNNKRKADDGFPSPQSKVMKSNTENDLHPRATTPADTRSIKPAIFSRTASPSSANVTIPYRGTSKLSSRLSPATVSSSVPTAQASSAAKAPKKGSYAEIMARAKVTQSKPPAVGTISHKPKDKMAISYKKELKMRKKAMKNKKLGIKDGSHSTLSGAARSSPASGSSNTRTAPQIASKVTAKAKLQTTYKGTMNAGTAAQKSTSRDRDGHVPRSRYDEYAATDDDDLDDLGEGDYDSEGSEDMEAGFSDVEQEESLAATVARKEDEEEARVEARLKSEKEQRKRNLEAMARKAKPQRY